MSLSDQGQSEAEAHNQAKGAFSPEADRNSSSRPRPLSQPARLYGGLAQAIRSTQGEQELLAAICRTVVEDGGCCAAWVEYVGSESRREPLLAAHSASLRPPPVSPPLLGACLHSPAAAGVDAGAVLEVDTQPVLAAWLAQAGCQGCRVVIVLPLGAPAAPYGVLGAGYCTDSLPAETVTTLADFAGLCTAALDAVHSRSERQRSEYVDAALVRSVLRDEFLAGVSHELRTPLMGILGVSEALQDQVYGPVTDRQRRALHSIEQSGLHLLELLNDILDIAKAESGHARLLLSSVAVDDVCRASLQMTQQLAQQKDQHLAYKIAPPTLTMEVDPRRLKQILVNLLSNAIKFTPMRGELGLEVIGDAAADVVRFTVWDHGIGIANEDMPRLFEPFVQLNVGLTRQFTGTGLGLALVKRMAELHGGHVSAHSVVGQGSTFVITLPWRQVAGPAQGMEAAGPIATRGRADDHEAQPLVLVIEDNEAAAANYVDILGRHGLPVSVAHTEDEAVRQAAALRPDLVLLNAEVAQNGSLHAIRNIRAAVPQRAAMSILVLTTAAARDDAAHFLAAGADAYLVKPITPDELLAAVEQQLESRRNRPAVA